MTQFTRVAVLLLIAAVLLPAALSGCPLCKEATSDTDTPGGSASLGRGFFYSILLMIATPWLAVGTVAFLIFRRRRRDRAAIGQPAAGVLLYPDGGPCGPPIPLDSRGARS